MIGWTNMASGGVNIQENKAIIHVVADTGRTIGFQKNGVGVYLKPDKSFIDIDNNNFSHWYYSISSSNYGEWTITATLGAGVLSDTITVNSNQQYDIELLYAIDLWNNGDNRPVTNGWQFSARSGSSSTRAITSTALVSYSTDNYTYTFFQPRNIQTISKSTLRATITGATINSSGDNKNIAVGLTNSLRVRSTGGETSDWRTIQSLSAAFANGLCAGVTSASNETINLVCDVSSVIGSQYYVGLLFGNAKGSCAHIWFE